VDSTPGVGTSFLVIFPAVGDDVERPGPGEVQAGHVHSGETILVVEDEEALRTLAQTILSKKGYTVLLAADGEQALRVCEEQEGRIHLLLTDVVMPGQSGPAVARELTGRYPHLKVIYMSGYTDDAIEHHGVLDSGVPYLEKPITTARLLRVVRDTLDGSPSRGG
jgi:two-component system cell cycle sensor histidine kinase/response regulator CckA